MPLNLIQFPVSAGVERLAQEFKEEKIIVAGNFTVQEAQKLNAGKFVQGNASNPVECGALGNVKFFSCKVLEKRDNAELQKFKGLVDFIAVRGSSPEMCAWAANTKGVDLLLQPLSSEKCFLDLQTANVLCGSNVFVCVLFNDFLEASGFRQAQLLKNAAMAVKLCSNAGTRILFASGGRNETQLRASKDLSSFGAMLGVKKEAALKAVRENSENFLERLK